jgi:prolyl-tRNA editing enzyme YbaK/EbsC (Cys-tRNA(Pro) deacylase)
MKDRHPITEAVRMLREHAVAFTHHPYDYEERGGTAVSARELGVDEHAVIKTLYANGGRRGYLVGMTAADLIRVLRPTLVDAEK